MANKNWIAGAVKHPGSFKKAAKGAGMGTAEYAHHVLAQGSNASTTTKRRASLALTLMGMHHPKQHKVTGRRPWQKRI